MVRDLCDTALGVTTQSILTVQAPGYGVHCRPWMAKCPCSPKIHNESLEVHEVVRLKAFLQKDLALIN